MMSLRLLLLTMFATALVAQEESRPATGFEVLQLRAQTHVTSAGVFLDELAGSTNFVVPHIRISAAPRYGQALTLSREQIAAALARSGESLPQLTGSPQVRVLRRTRPLDEEELKVLLTARLQEDHIQDRGELELRFARPWAAINVPDEPLDLRILDMPSSGVSSLFICRIELSTTNETVGAWQVSLAAKVWREIWTTRATLRRGTLLADADLVRERRDVLNIREPLADFDPADTSLELAEYVQANAPILERSLKPRPVLRRGQSALARVVDGALLISMKVEVLEDGIPGQVIRVRNPQTRRELRGKVQNEQTILVSL